MPADQPLDTLPNDELIAKVREAVEAAARKEEWLGYATSRERAREYRAALSVLADRLQDAQEHSGRLLYIAEHLFAMVPQQVWRDHGAEAEGHYEGDYHAEQVRDELAYYRDALARFAAVPPNQTDERFVAEGWFIPEGDRTCGVIHRYARATCMKRAGHDGPHATAQGTWIDGPWCEYPEAVPPNQAEEERNG